MKTHILNPRRPRGFTLMETVIAIGVLSVLLTGFLIVFIPAADGIKRSITSQEADRLVAALEQELVNTRAGETPPDVDAATGFEKALWRIRFSTGPIVDNKDTFAASQIENALLVYQYRGNPSVLRPDGSPEPVVATTGKKAGQDYSLVPMMRRKSSDRFLEELPAVEGSVYLVKCVQMVNAPDPNKPAQYALLPVPVAGKTRGNIYDPGANADDTAIATPSAYPDAVIAFAAEFYQLPSKAKSFLDGTGFTNFYGRTVKPTFTRNLAIRR
jgi:prepilin-type N-terminal cleavage/methylation domain-containing protein